MESLRRATAAQQAALQKEIEEKEALATRLSKTAGANESLAMRVGDLSLENEKLRATVRNSLCNAVMLVCIPSRSSFTIA